MEKQFRREEVEKEIGRIKSLLDDELLFFSLWYYYGVSYNAGSEYIEVYRKFHNIFKIPFENDFNDQFSKFMNEQILESDGGSEYISDLYAAAFETCLKEDKRINEFFGKLILSKIEIDRGYQVEKFCSSVISKNFNVLSKEVQELFIKAADDKDADTRRSISRSIIWNYNSLPTNVQKLILNKLIYDSNWVKEEILSITYYKFKTLPNDFREKVIMELGYPLSIIARYYNELPVDFQNQFRKRIKASFKEDFIRFGNASVRSSAINAITGAFENLPVDIREMLWLFVDDKSSDVRSSLARNLEIEFDKLPSNMRETILRKLSDDNNHEVRRFVIPAIISNIDKLPTDFSDILKKLATGSNILFLEKEIEDLMVLAKLQDKEKVISILNITKEKIRKEFAIKMLEKLSKDDNEIIRKQANEMLSEYKR